MRSLQQSAAYALMVFMTDSADHIAGKAGLTLTITASKAGAAFAGIAPTVTERGDGWYAVDLTAAHTDTLGDLAIRCTAAGADPTDLVCQVQSTAATLAAIQAKTDNLPSDPADQAILAAAVAGVPAAVRVELATELARVDVATSTRLASASYTAPANADVAAIKAKTDNLPSDPADQSLVAAAVAGVPAAVRVELATELARVDVATSTRLASAAYTAPDNAGIAAVPAAVRVELATELARIDVATSTRLATAGYTAPDNAGIATAAASAATAAATAADAEAAALAAEAAALAVGLDVDAVKAKTDSLTFTVAGQVDANVQRLNDAEVIGTGTLGDAWRGVGVPV